MTQVISKQEINYRHARCEIFATKPALSTVKANSRPCFPANCQWPRIKLIITGVFLKGITFWFRWRSITLRKQHPSIRSSRGEKNNPVVPKNTSRSHLELPVRNLTTGGGTCNRLTLFGNVTVHCKRGIFLWGAIHPTSGLDVDSSVGGGAVIRWPTTGSGTAADRSDVYSGSVNALPSCLPLKPFTPEPLTAPLISSVTMNWWPHSRRHLRQMWV